MKQQHNCVKIILIRDGENNVRLCGCVCVSKLDSNQKPLSILMELFTVSWAQNLIGHLKLKNIFIVLKSVIYPKREGFN